MFDDIEKEMMKVALRKSDTIYPNYKRFSND